MTTEYNITYSRAARFALVPGKAEQLFYHAYSNDIVEWRAITAGVLISRYSTVIAIGLGVFSALNASSTWPVAISCVLTAASTTQLYRYTKLFMQTVDRPYPTAKESQK